MRERIDRYLEKSNFLTYAIPILIALGFALYLYYDFTHPYSPPPEDEQHFYDDRGQQGDNRWGQ